MSRLLSYKGEQKLTDIKDVELIKELQDKLGVTADGIVGTNTLKAFANFKKKNYLAHPDVLGAGTATLLNGYKNEVISKASAEKVFGRKITERQFNDLNNCLRLFDITTPLRIKHFLAQVAHESGGLRWLLELASGAAYEGRVDLGNIHPGDGRKYKGGGALQMTGRVNYTRFSRYIGDPKVIELGATYVANMYPFSSAGFWWMDNGMNLIIDRGATVKQVSRRVNGGYNGLADRVAYFQKASGVIA